MLTKMVKNYKSTAGRTIAMLNLSALLRSRLSQRLARCLTLCSVLAGVGGLTWAGGDPEGGGWSSGGGNGVVCFKSPATASRVRRAHGVIPDAALAAITSIEAFDLYEARAPRGLDGTAPEVVEIQSGETGREYVGRIAQRMDHALPWIASLIRQGAESFPDSNVIVHPSAIQQRRDMANTDELTDPRCVISTLATQTTAENTSYLHLDGRLMHHPKHSALSRAVLFLHEALYHHALFVGQRDSRSTRHLVSELITRNPQQTVGGLLEKARSLGFISGDGSGVVHHITGDIFSEMRRLIAVTELDEIGFENHLEPYAHKKLAQLMNPIRTEALRIFDRYDRENATRKSQVEAAILTEARRAYVDCAELSVCVEKYSRLIDRNAVTSVPAVVAASAYLRERAAQIRLELATFAQESVIPGIQSIPGLPQTTQQQMGEDLLRFAQFLGDQSSAGMILYSSHASHFENPYLDSGSSLLLNGQTRLFRERVIFFKRNGGVKTSLDYPIE